MNDNNGIPAGERPAVPAPPNLRAEYKTDPKNPRPASWIPVYAFSTEGHPLVLAPDDTRLVRAEVAFPGMTCVGIRQPSEPPMTGPFTPAPPGLTAVFHDGHEEPIPYFDLDGRPVLVFQDEAVCYLTLTDHHRDVKRVEYRPQTPVAE